MKILTQFAATLKSFFPQGKGQVHVVKTCVNFKSMEVTFSVRVVFFVRIFQIGDAMTSKRGIKGILITM